MKYRIDAEWFSNKVQELQKIISEGIDISPLIVHYVDGSFELNDGNHRLEAYKNLGVKEINVIIWITEEEEYKEFIKKYEQYVGKANIIRK